MGSFIPHPLCLTEIVRYRTKAGVLEIIVNVSTKHFCFCLMSHQMETEHRLKASSDGLKVYSFGPSLIVRRNSTTTLA